MKRAQKNEPRVRINLILRGEPAEWLISWRERGVNIVLYRCCNSGVKGIT